MKLVEDLNLETREGGRLFIYFDACKITVHYKRHLEEPEDLEMVEVICEGGDVYEGTF